MALNLLIGVPVMIISLIIQSFTVIFCIDRYVRFRNTHKRRGWPIDTVLMSLVMIILSLGNFIQTAIWETLFLIIGEFNDFSTSLYYSGVTFFTIGYGDILMSPRWRLLGPLEAGHGVLMFGLSAAVMTAAMADIIKYHRAHYRNPNK